MLAQCEPPAAMNADRTRALSLMRISPRIVSRLETYVAILGKWNRSTRLVSPATLPTVWTRHIADSEQLIALAPEACIWVDIGSGGGLPGLIVAICLADRPGVRVHCIESDVRKAAFLNEAARATGAPVDVHNIRVEAPADLPISRCDVVTARAFASVDRLVYLARPYLQSGAIGIFPRGQKFLENSSASASRQGWRVNSVRSVIDPQSSILTIRGQREHPRDLQ